MILTGDIEDYINEPAFMRLILPPLEAKLHSFEEHTQAIVLPAVPYQVNWLVGLC